MEFRGTEEGRMKKLVLATVACGFVLSTVIMAGAQQGKAMQDAKDAKKDPNAVFDGRKTTVKPEVKAGPVTRQDPKAIAAKENAAAKARQTGAHIDGPKHAPPPPVVTKKDNKSK
jgi:Ni/Co efflux regulator RcnB